MYNILDLNEFHPLIEVIENDLKPLNRFKRNFLGGKELSSKIDNILLEYEEAFMDFQTVDLSLYYNLNSLNENYLIEKIKRSEKRDKGILDTPSNNSGILSRLLKTVFDCRVSYTPVLNEALDKFRKLKKPHFVKEEEIKTYQLKEFVSLMCITGMIDSYQKAMCKEYTVEGMIKILAEYMKVEKGSLSPLFRNYLKKQTKDRRYPHPSERVKDDLKHLILK